LEEEPLALEGSDAGSEVCADTAPAALVLVVDVAVDPLLALGLVARETTCCGLAGGTLSAGRLGSRLFAGAGGVGGWTSGGTTPSSVEVAAAAAFFVVEATVVVVEVTAFVVVAAVDTAFVVVVATAATVFAVLAATVETAFVVVATVDLAIATVEATESATGAPANRAPHDCAGPSVAAISTPAAIGPANDLALTCLIGPPLGVCSRLVGGLPRITAPIHGCLRLYVSRSGTRSIGKARPAPRGRS
jgi:voltage-gated potassium channel Kch